MIESHAIRTNLAGTCAQIGAVLGERVKGIPPLRQAHILAEPLTAEELKAAKKLLDAHCPGLTEEIAAMAESLGADEAEMAYYQSTHLLPRCFQLAVPPALAQNGHMLLCRSYEFHPMFEDFTLVRTAVKNKYAHIGTSVMLLGRDEGMNEMGLAMTMSANGMPVGSQKMMRAPAVEGLQYWAVVRAVLENCADVDEALSFIKDIPIAYNGNFILADKTGRHALLSTRNGRMKMHEGGDTVVHAANHNLFAEFVKEEPQAMAHSLARYRKAAAWAEGRQNISIADLQQMLLTPYPGPCCPWYTSFFGTTKSIIMDVTAGALQISWGGGATWQTCWADKPLAEHHTAIKLDDQPLPEKHMGMQPITAADYLA